MSSTVPKTQPPPKTHPAPSSGSPNVPKNGVPQNKNVPPHSHAKDLLEKTLRELGKFIFKASRRLIRLKDGNPKPKEGTPPARPKNLPVPKIFYPIQDWIDQRIRHAKDLFQITMKT